jgi:two-component system, NtrC family, response regulator HydG
MPIPIWITGSQTYRIIDRMAEDFVTLKRETAHLGTLAFRLAVETGPDVGRELNVTAASSRALVGTSAVVQFRLADPHVSRRHCAIGGSDKGLLLHDLGSRNGTLVNGARVVECYLRGGESIHIGSSMIRVYALGDASLEEPALKEFGRAKGISAAMRRIFAACTSLARSDVSILIEGESGVGKELIAECIHEAGPRAQAPFVVFDPVLANAEQMNLQLFGAEANVVAGTHQARPGVFEQANGGTVLIDSPELIPLDLQRKLLRVLERREVQRMGSTTSLPVNVRVIATSTEDLEQAIEQGKLREDFFYQLAGARLEIPPLRERREDVGLLTRHFFANAGSESRAAPPEVLARFESRRWPGNVRELQNAVALVVSGGDLALVAEHVAAQAQDGDALGSVLALDLPLPQAKQRMTAILEAAYIDRLLGKHGGNVARAAQASGIAHRYFQLIRARHRVK